MRKPNNQTAVAPVVVKLPPGARAKGTVQPGVTMTPEVIAVVPGQGGRVLTSGDKPVAKPKSAPLPSPFLDMLMPPELRQPQYDPTASISDMLHGVRQPQYDPNVPLTELLNPANGGMGRPALPPGNMGVPSGVLRSPGTANVAMPPPPVPASTPVPPASSVYQPNYTSAPARPPIATLPAAPVRDVQGEARQRQGAAQIAGLIPLLTLLTGGSGANLTGALGRAPGLLAQTGAAADTGADTHFNDTMARWARERGDTQGQNESLLAGWQAEVQAAQDANRQETERAKLSRDDRDAALVEERNREQSAAAQVKAIQSATQATARERSAFITQLQGMDDATQQRLLGIADERGELERLGIPATKGANGRYTFTVRKAPPIKLAPTAQEVAAQVAQARTKRLTKEADDLVSVLFNPRTSPQGKQKAAARLAEIKQNAPGVASVPFAASDVLPMTPGESASLALRRSADARAKAAAIAKGSSKGGVPLRAEVVTGVVGDGAHLTGARGVDFSGAPPEVFAAMQHTPALLTGTHWDAVKGVKIGATGTSDAGYYVDFVLPPTADKKRYQSLMEGLRTLTGIVENKNAAVSYLDGTPQGGRFATGRAVRVLFGAGKASVPAVKTRVVGGVRVSRPTVLSAPKKPAPQLPAPKILSIEEIK